MDALLNFTQQTPSPGTSQLLGRFEAIQKSFERHVNAEALAEMPSSSPERPLSFEATALILQGMQACMNAAPVPQANAGALACMPSGPVQQQHLPEARAAEKQIASQDAGSGTGDGLISPPIRIRRRKVGIQTLRALRDALIHAPRLDVTGWARTNHLQPRTIRNYVCKGALTPEAQNRLDVADGKAPRLRTMGMDDLRALRDALADNPELDVTGWSRVNDLHPGTIASCVFKGALTPEVQSRLDVADGKPPRLRKVETDDLRALSDALAHNSKLDVTAWARARNLNSHTVRSLVRKGTLRPGARKRLQRADGHPTKPRRTVAWTAAQVRKPSKRFSEAQIVGVLKEGKPVTGKAELS